MKYPQCEWCKKHVAVINIWGNVFLAALKAIVGLFGNSRALIADAIHSLSDVFMAILLYIGLKISGQRADKIYPYGYGHIEFIVAGFIGFSLICVSIVIWYTSIKAIISGVLTEPKMIAVLTLLVSIVANELLFRHSICIGKKTESPAIIANAWENRADALTSCAAFVGVAGAKLGYPILDPIGAIAVGVVISHSAIKILSEAVGGMMDASANPETINKIYNIASSVKGIKKINSLSTRKSGQKILVDMEVAIAPEINLKKAKGIGEHVKEVISKAMDNIGDIIVHLRPYKT